VSWRQQAVARSLDSARARAESRVQRFLDAAVELMREKPEFTVQDVVERSGQSLRSFYLYFGGKHELLLALFEESVHSTAELLRAKVAEEDDALERVHRLVVEYHALCRPGSNGKAAKKPAPAPLMVEFAQQLLTAHPAEAARAFVPLVEVFGEVLDQAAAAGVLRPGLRPNALSGIVLETIMFNVFASVISGAAREGDAAEQLWDFIVHGIGVTPGR